MFRFISRAATLAVALILAGAPSFSQTERATIRGTITDTSGAVVSDASVVVTNQASGETRETVSSSAGVYQVPLLSPGVYTITAEVEGFKKLVRENVRLAVAQILGLDLTLEVGNVAESVTVSATAISLQRETTEVSTSINPKSYVELPLQVSGGSGRSVENFIFLAPGTSGDTFNAHINGSQTLSKEIQMDGMSMSTSEVGGDPRVIALPPEAVQEFSLVTNNFSAEYGNTGGGVERLVVRSGTNEFHGNAYEFLRNDKLDARGFFAANRQIQRRNEFGASLGGPIAKNRTFFFTNFHWFKYRSGAINSLGSIPTTAMRTGDFGELIPAGEGVIYDPATTTQVGTDFVRDPFANNMIPASRHSNISMNIWDLVPQPDRPGIFNNIFAQGNQRNDNRNNTVKLDHNLNSYHRLSVMWTFGKVTDNGPFAVLPGPIRDSRDGLRGPLSHNGRINYDWVVSPTVLFHMGAGIGRQDQLLANPETQGAGWPERLGLRGVDNGAFPEIIIDPWNSYARNQRGLPTLSTTYLYSPSLSWTRGKHNLKFGSEIRKLQNNFTLLDHSGGFRFSRNETALPGSAATTGNVLASFLLGEVDGGSFNITPMIGTRHSYYAWYVQDDYKVRPNITINLGLRHDIFTPLTEVNNRHSIMDPNAPNPAADGYLGALVFAGDCDVCTGTQRLVGNDTIAMTNFGPRLGLAWSIRDNLVFRTAYGMSFFPTGGLGGSNAKAPSVGFSNTAVFQSLDGGITSGFNWENGFPQNFARPPLRDPGFATGGNVPWWNSSANKPLYTQSFNAGFQYQFAPTWLLDLSWVGNKSNRLVTGVFNPMQVDSRHLALGNLLTLPIDDPAVAAAGFSRPYPSFKGPLSQALRPFPQYNGLILTQSGNVGQSSYHSLQMKVEKEFSNGLFFLTSYSWAKTLTDSSSALAGFFSTGARDQFNRGVEKALALYDVPHRVVTAFNYELPFGEGKAIGGNAKGALNKIIGGWQLNAIMSYQSGTPLLVTQNNATPIFASKQMPNMLSGVDVELDRSNFDPATDRVLNINAFENTGRFVIGNAPSVLPNARSFPLYNEDFGILKRTPIAETVMIEFRFEVFNAFNRVRFAAPETSNVSNPNGFGLVGGQGNAPRSGQFSLKVLF